MTQPLWKIYCSNKWTWVYQSGIIYFLLFANWLCWRPCFTKYQWWIVGNRWNMGRRRNILCLCSWSVKIIPCFEKYKWQIIGNWWNRGHRRNISYACAHHQWKSFYSITLYLLYINNTSALALFSFSSSTLNVSKN